MDDTVFGQGGARIRFDWGLTGARALRGTAPPQRGGFLVVVVDVLSFTTSVSVAVDRGVEVFPFPWRDERAADHAARHGATLARARSERDVSLSPASLRHAPGLARVVLPSPNGSTISLSLAEDGVPVVAACLRNAAAVGAHVTSFLDEDPGHVVAVVAGGERWPDGSLRPAVEDLWGGGAVVAAIAGHDDDLAPEAEVAAAAYRSACVGHDGRPGPAALRDRLRRCVSGRELVDQGFGADVEIAAEVDASDVVPVLVDGRFVGHRAGEPR
ncbi:2-phosphosulfolactate phosphatase [Oerskovia jenensis]|uniref:Probable 2-phosphosulfolactate phosphatase n=1 Tax=Oerskovia jenensis TaxID=162169 RepID=A0ABS2L9M5_9CELL|nr:2-phosphosulfolactate phosphatase [Oerskovia jenensis]MBM7477102.1 2-phosphosulfolactate phosphatase [Oerskovia jenensis]